MIDPTDIINYNRTTAQLEEFLLFAMAVAGKKSSVQAVKLEDFLTNIALSEGQSPFDKLRVLDIESLESEMRKVKLGKYNTLVKGYSQLANSDIDLRTCSESDLLSFHGIGSKTAKFFLMFTRKDQHVAALDTHILSHLREKGFDAPKETPATGSSEYRRLETAFLELASDAGMSPAAYDLSVWVSRAG